MLASSPRRVAAASTSAVRRRNFLVRGRCCVTPIHYLFLAQGKSKAGQPCNPPLRCISLSHSFHAPASLRGDGAEGAHSRPARFWADLFPEIIRSTPEYAVLRSAPFGAQRRSPVHAQMGVARWRPAHTENPHSQALPNTNQAGPHARGAGRGRPTPRSGGHFALFRPQSQVFCAPAATSGKPHPQRAAGPIPDRA